MNDSLGPDSPAPSTPFAAQEAPESDANDPLLGRLISERYRVLERIAQGGMGAVYLGEHVLLRKRVAIKILRPEAASEPQLVGRFEREAVAGAHVSHPHVAGATDFGQEPDGCQFLVLEYVRGRTLAEEIQRGPLPPRRALNIARQLAGALEAVHDKDIVHRDVKPRNVILAEAEGGAAKLVDFGFAKVRADRLSTVDADDPMVNSWRDLTIVGTVFGTVAYMPPEVGYGMDGLDARADLYALGVTFYEMLAGVPPFTARSNAELFAAIMETPPPPIAARAPGVVVPAALENVVRRLLEKDPAARYQSAGALLVALDAAAATVWGSSPSSGPAPARSPVAPPLAPDSSGRLGDVARALLRKVARTTKTIFGAVSAASARVPGSAQGNVQGDPRGDVSARGPRHVGGLHAIVHSFRSSPSFRRSALLVGLPLLLLPLLLALWVSSRDGEDRDRAPELAVAVAESSTNVTSPQDVTEIDGVDADGWVQRLAEAARSRVHNRGAEAVLALAQLDPSSLRRAPVRADAIAAVVGIAFEENAQADAVFSVLEEGLGEDGLEMLYEIVRSKRGTKAYERAVKLLGDAVESGRASPALRLAFEMRRSTCPRKKQLFERAPREGDERLLTELKALKYAPCRRATDPCCFREDAELGRIIDELSARLARDTSD